MKYKIAIVGTADTVLGFKAMGLITHSVTDSSEVTALMERLVNEEAPNPDKSSETIPKYAVIFILEELAQAIPEDHYRKFASKALPAIIPLPGPKGSTGFGEERLKKLVIQAVGTEI